MNYNCPKCDINLRYRFKGILNLACPACGVQLYRTVASSEIELSRTFEPKLWLFALATAGVLTSFMAGSPYLWPTLIVAMLLFYAFANHRAHLQVAKEWPRWTDQAPR